MSSYPVKITVRVVLSDGSEHEYEVNNLIGAEGGVFTPVPWPGRSEGS